MNKEAQLSSLLASVRSFIESPEHPAARFEELALEIFRFQFAHNLPYQRLSRAFGVTPKTLAHWTQIPAVITSAFKEAEFTALDPAARTHVFYSSGTTARDRSRHFHSAETLGLYETSLLRWFKPFVLPDLASADFILLSPPPAQAPNSSLVHMFETVSRAFGRGTYYASAGPNGAWHLDFNALATASHGHPVIVCGTAFSFVHLCDWLAENNRTLRLPANSRVFETGGYKGRSRTVTKPELHALISKHLNIPETHIVSEYGMSELSSQAYDRVCGTRAPRHFQFPPWTRLQIIDPNTATPSPPSASSPSSAVKKEPLSTAQPGLIRVFDLANIASIMAVQTEDLGLPHEHGFELLGRAALVEPRGCSLMPA